MQDTPAGDAPVVMGSSSEGPDAPWRRAKKETLGVDSSTLPPTPAAPSAPAPHLPKPPPRPPPRPEPPATPAPR
eukprot:287226-Karenia_brevis.AAC.1